MASSRAGSRREPQVSAPPVLGRPSQAASATAVLRASATAATATYRAEGGSAGWCELRAASIAGVRHRLAGEHGEDSFAWAHRDERLAVAVADGLGSVPGSAEAAARAGWAAVEAAVEAPGSLGEAAAEAIDVAERVAASGDGATTLLVAVLDRDGSVALARVGDSSAFVVDHSGATWYELFDGPADDEVVTATAALPGGAAAAEHAATVLTGGSVVALATDGIADPWRDGPTTVGPAMAAALVTSPSPLELARIADFSRQGCHDDRTLVALWLVGL